MSKYTPGPWVVDKVNKELVGPMINGAYWYVAQSNPLSLQSMEEEKANARLIAAAPTMLDLLKEIKSLYENMEDVPYWVESIRELERSIYES